MTNPTTPQLATDACTLTIDIGGTGIKMIAVDGEGRPLGERARELTPKPSPPEAVLEVIQRMLAEQAPYDRVSVGFPGVVRAGVVKTAANLGAGAWQSHDLESAIAALTGKPTRVLNDADLQGYGVIDGQGVELVLTLGTGLGSALFVDGHLVPNLELGHHPWKRGLTYEAMVSDAERKKIGKKKWRKRVMGVLDEIEPIFNYDRLHVGGGNAKLLEDLPEKVRIFDNVEGMTGGVRLWRDR